MIGAISLGTRTRGDTEKPATASEIAVCLVGAGTLIGNQKVVDETDDGTSFGATEMDGEDICDGESVWRPRDICVGGGMVVEKWTLLVEGW
eukprot:scaffold21338_cov24-Cyclotella_meneghiniana.AAC.3